jgi:hypothetical protein
VLGINDQYVHNSDDAEQHLDISKPGKLANIIIARGENGNKIELQAIPQDLFTIMEERKKKLLSPFLLLKPS